jgi:hypothetical protein
LIVIRMWKLQNLTWQIIKTYYNKIVVNEE